jgi:hypothetical protein
MTSFMAIIASMPEWLTAITALVTACAGVAALTPTKSDDKIIGMVLNVINVVGLNFGKAKNADDT